MRSMMAKPQQLDLETSTDRYRITPSLLEYANKITFPWPLDAELDGSAVGVVFFEHDATQEWSTPDVQEALVSLSRIVSNDTVESSWRPLIERLLPAPVTAGQHSLLSDWKIVVGLVLLLDQGPRNILRKGTNMRYIYHHFDFRARDVINILLQDHLYMFRLETWRTAGISTEQAILRILMLLAPLVHSETLDDQYHHLMITAEIRSKFEAWTGTSDPHRKTFHQDVRDIYLMNSLLTQGPPKGDDALFSDFVYWMIRYYTSHVAYVEHFGRSPFRNVAVGRADKPGEEEWLRRYGIVWDDDDEKTRTLIKRDIEEGKWTPLDL